MLPFTPDHVPSPYRYFCNKEKDGCPSYTHIPAGMATEMAKDRPEGEQTPALVKVGRAFIVVDHGTQCPWLRCLLFDLLVHFLTLYLYLSFYLPFCLSFYLSLCLSFYPSFGRQVYHRRLWRPWHEEGALHCP